MNMTELLAISNSNLSLAYDTRTQIFSLYMDIGNYPYCIYSGSNINNTIDDRTLSYIAEVIIYFSQCTPPIYDVDGLDYRLMKLNTINLRNLVRQYPDFVGYADERTAQGFQGLHIYIFDRARNIALDTNIVVKGMHTPLTKEQRYRINKTLERLHNEQS